MTDLFTLRRLLVEQLEDEIAATVAGLEPEQRGSFDDIRRDLVNLAKLDSEAGSRHGPAVRHDTVWGRKDE